VNPVAQLEQVLFAEQVRQLGILHEKQALPSEAREKPVLQVLQILLKLH
jgi:hypothetical protein